MPVRFASSAEADLLDLWLVIAAENPMAADKVLDSIYGTAMRLVPSRKWVERDQNWLIGFVVSRPRHPTLFSICLNPMRSSSSEYCTMRAISISNISEHLDGFSL